MDTNTDSIASKASTSFDQGSNAAAAGLVVVGVAVMAGSYYAVRRGIDRRIARQIKKHIKTGE